VAVFRVAPGALTAEVAGAAGGVMEAVSKLPPDQVTADLNAVADYSLKLPVSSGKLFVGGFCWGGGQTFRFATNRPDLSAAFVFYGGPPDKDAMARIKAPVYGFYAGNDERAKAFTKAIAELLTATFPDRFVATLSKSRRKERIFVDYLRNAEGATAVCAYSPRARANAPVSTPIAWEELRDDVRFDHFSVRNIPARLGKLKSDPWRDFLSVEQSVTAAMLKRVSVSK
jgi:pimeloyl-ACP methyl ester carboxylesterase